MKAEVIETRLVSRFLGIGGVQDRQVYFTVRKMNRAVLGAVHLFHVEHLLVETSQLVRLVGENREMTEFGHCLSSLAVLPVENHGYHRFFLLSTSRAISQDALAC